MKWYIQNLTPLLFTLVIIFLPLISIAAFDTSSGGGSIGIPTGQGGGNTGLDTAPGGGATGYQSYSTGGNSLQNPLKVTNFCDLLKIILQAILIIGLPVAVVFLVIVGFKFIIARGNPTAIDTAKANLLHTVIGIAIFLGAWTIAKVIAATMAALGVPGLGSCGQ